MEFNKKAIGPVVATALLLVVVVVAVMAFSSWFAGYQSKINADVETRGSAGSLITVERLEADGTVYLKNTGSIIETISIKVGACSYAIPQNLTGNSVTQVATDCTTSSNTVNEVVVSTATGVFSGTAVSR